jgi:ribosomal protein S18 acetylase RimI-like enzyme
MVVAFIRPRPRSNSRRTTTFVNGIGPAAETRRLRWLLAHFSVGASFCRRGTWWRRDRIASNLCAVMQVRRLRAEDVSRVAAIDRSEHVELQYQVIDGQLQQVSAAISEVPAWDLAGPGPHTVAAKIEFCRSVLARGGALLGACAAEQTIGLAIIHPTFEPPLAWLAFLHVSRPHRRRGAAQALWAAAVEISIAAGAESIYVSATPTESAVGFYLRQGCRLAQPVHPDLFAAEPEDIHLTCCLR